MVIDFDIFAFLGLILIFGLVGWYLKKKQGKSRLYLIFYGFFAFYLIAMYSNTIFPLAYFGHDFPPNLWQSINCIPFVGLFKWESLMNLCLLVPFGFAVPFIRKIPNTKTMIPVMVIPGFMLELIQFLSGLISAGYTWRLIDINDYMMYSVGIALGYLIFRIVASLVLDLFPNQSEEASVMNYIWEIFYKSTPRPPKEAFGDEGY
jgi:glycopeptide antibiotics resistance protein